MRSTCTARRPRGRRGFTLIEILLSVLILSMAMVALMSMLSHAGRTQRFARYEMLCSTAAQDLFARLEGGPFSDISSDNAQTYAAEMQAALQEQGVPDPTAEVEIAPWPDTATAHLRRVTVTVQFGGDTVRVKDLGSIRLETLFCDEVQGLMEPSSTTTASGTPATPSPL